LEDAEQMLSVDIMTYISLLEPYIVWGFLVYILVRYFSDRNRKRELMEPVAQALQGRLEVSFFGRVCLRVPREGSEVRIILVSQKDPRRFSMADFFIRTLVHLGPRIISLSIEQDVESGLGLWIQPKGTELYLRGLEASFSGVSTGLGDDDLDSKYQIWTNDLTEAQNFLAEDRRRQALYYFFAHGFSYLSLSNHLLSVCKTDCEVMTWIRAGCKVISTHWQNSLLLEGADRWSRRFTHCKKSSLPRAGFSWARGWCC